MRTSMADSWVFLVVFQENRHIERPQNGAVKHSGRGFLVLGAGEVEGLSSLEQGELLWRHLSSWTKILVMSHVQMPSYWNPTFGAITACSWFFARHRMSPGSAWWPTTCSSPAERNGAARCWAAWRMTCEQLLEVGEGDGGKVFGDRFVGRWANMGYKLVDV